MAACGANVMAAAVADTLESRSSTRSQQASEQKCAGVHVIFS